MTSANISDPVVIRDFRARLAKFANACSSTLGSRASELGRTHDWLRGQQLPHWKSQAARREEAYQNARRLYLQAEAEVASGAQNRGPRKPSSYEEKLEMEKARRHRDEAEEKLALVRRWVLRLEHEADPLIQQCQSRDLALRELCDRALLQLERMADRVQAYLDLPRAGMSLPPMPSPGADGRGGGA